MSGQAGRDRICRRCYEFLIPPPTSGEIYVGGNTRGANYGTLNDIRNYQACPICRLILKLIPFERAPTSSHVFIDGTLDSGLTVFYKDVYRGSITHNPPAGFASKPLLLNPGLVIDWIKECESDHDNSLSKRVPRYKHAIELILIDVFNRNLVRASSTKRFLTLSYVWGDASIDLTTTKNRADRERKGALSTIKLPGVILDAMSLVSQLEERYLWVDCLCIEQDNPSQKHSQIAQMDIIYSQSVLTIVALSSEDAASPLPGVYRRKRSFVKAKEFVVDRYRYAIPPRLLDIAEASKYESRGWTFQERLLSNRCLFFTECDIYYLCHGQLRRETGISSLPGEEHSFAGKYGNLFKHVSKRASGNWIPIFKLYSSLVNEYSKRQLTVQADVLDAFSGISSVLEHSLGSRSVSGLLECILDTCLLWAFGRNESDPERNPNFPSWSWAGWKGEVVYYAGPLYLTGAEYSSVLLRSMVDRFEILSISPLRPVSRIPQDETSVTGHRKNKLNMLAKAVDILSFHAATINISQINTTSESINPRGDVFIFPDGIRTCSTRTLRLVNKDGIRCGFLHSWSPGQSKLGQKNHRGEVIALSQSNYPSSTYGGPQIFLKGDSESYNIIFDDNYYRSGDWCLINIMVIVWTGDMAERLTTGQMHIDAWRELEPKLKLIRLG